MVQLEEVEDQDLVQEQPGPIKDEDYDSADFVDTDSELSEDEEEDETVPAESLGERLAALKDIIPPPLRRRIVSSTQSLISATKTTASYGGKSLYVLSTGTLMILVPFAMAYMEEQQYVEEERQMKARGELNDAVTPGLSSTGAAGGQAL